jgi:hypothetical protein
MSQQHHQTEIHQRLAEVLPIHVVVTPQELKYQKVQHIVLAEA